MSRTMVHFDHVSKRFRLGAAHDSLGDLIASGMRRLVGRGARSTTDTLWALRDVDFSVAQGESVGIIGPNGAGKSTVLKLLSGIIQPNGGSVSVHGRLAALIEVGAGFHGDLTGRENIFLNGNILGMCRKEIRSKLDAIVAFAGLERFLDTPVKRYSSGMYARLGFSIASHVEPEVLLVDEVLSVGDAVFRLRCMDRMRQLVAAGTTLVFVTHDLDQMQAICARAVVLENGRVGFSGRAHDAVSEYMKAMSRSYAERGLEINDEGDQTPAATVHDLSLTDADGTALVWARPNETIHAELSFSLARRVPRLVVELNLRASIAENLISVNSGRGGTYFDGRVGRHSLRLTLPSVPVSGGQYLWNVRMWDADTGAPVIDTPFRFPMVVDDGGIATGALALPHEWTHVGPTHTAQQERGLSAGVAQPSVIAPGAGA